MNAPAPLIPVSTGRAITSRDAGPYTVTLMQHAGDVRLGKHRHSEAIIGLLLRGRYDERLGRRTVEPARASLLIKPPETAHANQIGRDGTDTILIQVMPARIPSDFSSLLGDAGIRLDGRFFALGQDILRELRTPAPDGLALEGLVTELLAVADARSRSAGSGRSSRQRWVTIVRDLLHGGNSSLTLAEIAHAANVDRAHLARAFRDAFGCTIGEYRRALRIEEAARRLQTTADPLSRIALDLGFFDQAHFTRDFRATYGTSPRAWRQRVATQTSADPSPCSG